LARDEIIWMAHGNIWHMHLSNRFWLIALDVGFR
jgi:hypothetical protein